VLQIRVLPPADRSDAVLRLLADDPGVANLRRFPGAAVAPPGDVIEAEVAREAADGLLHRLRGLALPDGGSVTLTGVDTALGEPVERAQAAAPGHGVDAVVWEEVAQRTEEEATLSWTFLTFLVAACLIASAGLLTDSSVLIVGSMVLGPEFGPLAAVAVALVRRRWRVAGRSLVALLVGFPLAVAATAGGAALLGATLGIPKDYLEGHRTLTAFVSHPDAFSVIVALVAGVAGTVSLTAAKSTSLVGVFISVTTIPAAANIATALVTGRPDEALGATVQLGVNLACILLAAEATLLVQRAGRRRRGPTGTGA
jgi:uncharacterized hydrophobic protein (TIGR00271 family)